MVNGLLQDLRFGARLLTKERSFTIAAVIVLGLGIGLAGATFIVVNSWFLREPPYAQPEGIVWLATRDAQGRTLGVSHPDFVDWSRNTRSFSTLVLFANAAMNVRDEGHPTIRLRGAYISAQAFGVLGQRALLGRDFGPADDRLGATPVVMLGHQAWTDRYASDSSIIGRSLVVNGVPATVIGVMRGGAIPLTRPADVWMPLAQAPTHVLEPRDARNFIAYGRLADGVSLGDASGELAVISSQLARAYPETNRGIAAITQTYREHFFLSRGGSKGALFFVAGGAVILVLLIACANVANLMLVRSTKRIHELGIRMSLGATRARIVGQILVETLLLAFLGGLVGTGVTLAGLRLINGMIGPLPDWMQLTIDLRMFMALILLCAGSGVLAGVAPAFYASRTGTNELLTAGNRAGTEGPRARKWTSALLIGELASTLVLLAAAASLMQALVPSSDVDPGVVDSARLITISLDLEGTRYSTAARRRTFVGRLEEQVGATPGVQSVAVTTDLPLGGGFARQLELDGRVTPAELRPVVTELFVTEGYFETLGVRVVQGRPFNGSDGAPGLENAIVNERFAALHFADADPIGRRLRLFDNAAASDWITVVGISRNVPQRWESDSEEPVVYLPYRGEAPSSAFVIVRSVGDQSATARLLRQRMQELDPDLPQLELRTFDEVLAQARLGFVGPTAIFSMLALVALGFTGISIYGLTGYAVSLRRREIGVRIALGAQAQQIYWLVVRQVVVAIGLGAAVGMLGAAAVGRVMQSVIPQTDGTNPTTVIVVLVIAFIACITGCAGPAWRATHLDPAMTLRNE